MSILKKKITHSELAELILKTGYERYNILNSNLKDENYVYDEFYFYIVWQVVNFRIFNRLLVFKNIISENTDLFCNFYNVFCKNIVSNSEDDILSTLVYINLELKEIWKHDDDTNSHNELYNTANYLVNEMFECEDNQYCELKNFFVQYITDCHFENKNIIKNFKIIEEE